MTNAEKFKTADERFKEFKKFCKENNCEGCICKDTIKDYSSPVRCILVWLEMEYNESELSPCPFCGDEATTFKAEERYYVACVNDDCIASCPMNSFSSEAEAIAAWNKRKNG